MSDEKPAPEDQADIENAIGSDQDGLEAVDPPADETGPQALQAQIDDLRDRLLRAVADADNTRKRAAREVKETREYAVTGFARDMLDVADNLARALGSLSDEARASLPEGVKPLLEGVEMTERRLLSSMERHGVKRIAPEPGEPLDPNRHQAAAQIPHEQPKGRIAHVMQPGYMIGERTLRAAMVVVSAGPAEGEGQGDTPAQPKKANGSTARPGSGLDVEA